MAFLNALGSPTQIAARGEFGADPNALAIGNMSRPMDERWPVGHQQPHKKGINLGDILGTIGDALLIANGRQGVYGAHKQQQREDERNQQANDAFANYLGTLDPGIVDLIRQAGPSAGMQAYGLMHPGAKEAPAGYREFELYNQLPDDQRASYEKYLQLTHPGMMSPISMGPNDSIEMPGQQGGDVPTVNSQEEYDALPNGARYRDSQGNPGVKRGGPTAGPSGVFPGQ